ncbi:MAG: hypothetical protein GY930_17025 [bacterium]|nr:hypothetical protein [bacterium]
MGENPSQPQEPEPKEASGGGGTVHGGKLAELTEQQRWELLRSLLVGPEEARISELERNPRKPDAQDVGAVLAEAVDLRAREGSALARALAPTVERSLKVSAGENPEVLADAIQPVIGPAARRTFQNRVQALEATLGNRISMTWSLLGVALLALVVFGVDGVRDHNLRRDRRAALRALAEAPGYSVHGEGSASVGEFWSGLRDPLADSWEDVCKHSPEELQVLVRWTPFVSLEAEMVQRRALAILQVPDGVQARVARGELLLSGEASAAWVRSAMARAPGIPGIQRISSSELVDKDRRAIEQQARSLHGLTMPFEAGASSLDRGQPIVQARLAALGALDDLVEAYGGSLLRLQLQATPEPDGPPNAGLLGRRQEHVHRVLDGLDLGATVIEVLPSPEGNAGRPGIAGVRIELSILLPKR